MVGNDPIFTVERANARISVKRRFGVLTMAFLAAIALGWYVIGLAGTGDREERGQRVPPAELSPGEKPPGGTARAPKPRPWPGEQPLEITVDELVFAGREHPPRVRASVKNIADQTLILNKWELWGVLTSCRYSDTAGNPLFNDVGYAVSEMMPPPGEVDSVLLSPGDSVQQEFVLVARSWRSGQWKHDRVRYSCNGAIEFRSNEPAVAWRAAIENEGDAVIRR